VDVNSAGEKIRRLLVRMLHDEQEPAPGLDSGRGIRHFDTREQQALTTEACGYLLEQSRRGEILGEHRELIIQYASQLGGLPLERHDVEELLDHLVFASPPGSDPDEEEPPMRAH
jgi:uncharacterized protein Smg (DUF494 family)